MSRERLFTKRDVMYWMERTCVILSSKMITDYVENVVDMCFSSGSGLR